MITLLAFIFVFLLVVIVHEWGHFFAARKSGMRVEEFGFGLPPKIYSWKGKQTEYSINALPIGGFVRIAGENGIETGIPKEEQFDAKPWYKQAAVLVAGVICNVLLGFVLFFIAYLAGAPITTGTGEGTPTLLSVQAGSPAALANLKVGDTIIAISQNGVAPQSLDTDTVHDFLQTSTAPVSVTYADHGVTQTTLITPETVNGERMLGVDIELVSTHHTSILEGISYAWFQTHETLFLIFTTLGQLLAKLFSHHPSAEGILGPVGLVKEVGSAASIGFAYLLAFAGAISMNLAAINILPFPALDGGRLVVVLLEALTRRKFSKEIVSIIHAIGFIVLLAVMVILTIHDLRG